MTVAINTTAMRSSAHGIGRYVSAMLTELLRADPGRYLIYSTPTHFSRWRSLGALELRRAPAARGLRLIWEQARLPALLQREGVSVLWGPAHAVPIWKTTRQVLTVHDLTWFNYPSLHTRGKGAYFRAMLRIATRRADRIVASSATTARDLEQILHVDPNRIRTVLLAPDASFRPATETAKTHVGIAYDLPSEFILALGVVEPRKNLLSLLRAVEALARRGMEVGGASVGIGVRARLRHADTPTRRWPRALGCRSWKPWRVERLWLPPPHPRFRKWPAMRRSWSMRMISTIWLRRWGGS